MKKIMVLMLLVFAMSGCGDGSYTRDTAKGKVVEITLDEMQQKLDKKDSFVVIFTTTMCSYCKQFQMMLEKYLPTHHVVVYDVVLDHENRTENENRQIVNVEFPEFASTPGIFYVKDGKKVSYLPNEMNGISEQHFDEWVIDNKIDNKE